MRQNYTTIPWGPVVPHETYEGYVAFCQRQKDRQKHSEFDRRHQDRRVAIVTQPVPKDELDLREFFESAYMRGAQ